MLDNSGDMMEESTSCVLKSAPFSCHAEWLTGKTSDKQIEIGHFFCVDFGDVIVEYLLFGVIHCSVGGFSVLVYFAEAYTLIASRFFKSASEAAYTRKAVEKFNSCGHHSFH